MMTSLVLVGGFGLFLLLGVPIAYALAFASLGAIWSMGSIPLMIVPQRLAEGINSFPIMAVPLFLLAGALMNAGGATMRLVTLAMRLVGHINGGLGHVVVVTNMIMAGMSGSAVADAVGTGSILIPAMKKEGYSSEFAAGLTAAASTIGPVIPPSIPFVVYGVLAEVNIGDLFMAGFIPGVLMGIALMIYVRIKARTSNYPRHERASFGQVMRTAGEAAPALLLPLIIVGGIVGGVFTPTEAAGAAAVYALVLGLFVYRELKLRQLPAILWEAAHNAGVVLFILASAGIFSWLMTVTQVAEAAQALVISSTNQAWVVLAIFNVILLIMGCCPGYLRHHDDCYADDAAHNPTFRDRPRAFRRGDDGELDDRCPDAAVRYVAVCHGATGADLIRPYCQGGCPLHHSDLYRPRGNHVCADVLPWSCRTCSKGFSAGRPRTG